MRSIGKSLGSSDSTSRRSIAAPREGSRDDLLRELEALRRSEAALRDFIETTTVSLHWVGVDGTILWANQAELDLLGYRREDYVGRNISDFHVDQPVIEDMLRRLVQGERLRDYPARLRCHDGSIRHVVIDSNALFEEGKFLHTRCFTRDVTALRNEQEASLLLGAIVDSSDDAIISKDLTGRITSWNRGAERIFGYTAEEAVGKSITMLIPKDRQSEEPQILARLQKGERVDHFETIRRRKDGSHVAISLTISPVKDGSGRIVGASKIARDITVRKRDEEAITSLNAQLKAELTAITRMQELSTRLIREGAVTDLLHEILDAGIAIAGATAGNIQLRDPDGALRIAAHQGFEAGFLEFFARVCEGPSVCAIALQTGERVIIEDVATDPLFAETPALPVLLEAGVRAVQSTPLVSRSGKLLGMFSTHFGAPHRPPERDLHLIDMLARQAADLIERTRTEQVRAQLSAIVESSGDSIYNYDFEGTILTWNRAAEELYGFEEREIVGRNVEVIVPAKQRVELLEVIHPAIRSGKILRNLETLRMRRDGSPFAALLTISPIRDENGKAVAISVIARDISDQKRNEESLRETQKLESLGLLAGGIAHDFNNLLTGVIGNASLLADDIPSGSPEAAIVQSLIDASERMARLTSQMLAFSGRGHFVVEPVDLSKQVIQISSLIQASIPKSVELRLSLANRLPTIDADISQLQQIIMNLVINASEAIGAGNGTVEIRTGVETVQAEELQANMTHTTPSAGTYVVLTVKDTGSGMDEETRGRIFDPFFTTKFTGRGLGLSSVLGIVRGHKGLIIVDSAPGAGTKFRVFFPISTMSVHLETVPMREVPGHGTILVVDDEDVVRRIAKAVLQKLGYAVITAVNGEEALRLYAIDPGKFDLVLLDMTMPVMGGEETLKGILEMRPDAVVIAMSGFHEREAKQRFGDRIAGFVQKPFSTSQLGTKIADIRRSSTIAPTATSTS